MKIEPELRTAAFVPRWSIFWKLTKDTVAIHSFYVGLYANLIADIIDWKGPRAYLIYSALVHDLDECFTGDIMGPAKKRIVDKVRANELTEQMMEERLSGVLESLYKLEDEATDDQIAETTKIVKAADLLDALIHLTLEKRMGNNVVDPIINNNGWPSLEAAWRNLPATKDVLDRTWNTKIVPSVKDHSVVGGYGI